MGKSITERRLVIMEGPETNWILRDNNNNCCSKVDKSLLDSHRNQKNKQRKLSNSNKAKSIRFVSSGITQKLVLKALVLLVVSENAFAVPHLPDSTIAKATLEDPPLPTFIRQPMQPTPKIMPCGTAKNISTYEELYIESPNYSDKKHYPNSASCEWKFQFPGQRVKMSCPNFSLTEFLCFDHLEVQGSNGIHNRYCGTNGPKDLIISEEVTIRFATSPFFGNVGFRCSIVGLDDVGPPVGPVEPPSKCQCGKKQNEGSKIVNGVETEIGEFPWMVGLVRKNGSIPFCGGSLINDRYILTAAHCVVGRTPYNLEILVNVHGTEVGKEGPDRRAVEAIFSHGRYTTRLDYDAALIKIEEPLNITQASATPVCLPRGDDLHNPYVGINATVTGWGLTTENGDLSPVLRKAYVQTMDNEECSSKYTTSITDRMICAAAPGTDACQGDSGGPLIYESDPAKKKFTQIGIISWGIGCARPNKPGVYARITEIMNWILRTTVDGSYCDESSLAFIGSAK